MPQQQMYSAIANSPGTELSAAITATTTTIPVLSGSILPDGPNIITIGVDETSETVLYTSKSGNSLIGCTRGFGGTTAKSWAAASRVARYYTAYDHEAFRKNITDLSGVTNESTADILLSAGQQILNATKNARLQGLKVQGRTLIDLLGGAGSGESLTGWLQSTGVPVTTSTTQKRSGSSSFKATPSASGSSYLYRDYSIPLDKTQQYVVIAWVFIESGNNTPEISLRDVGTFTNRYPAYATASKVGEWQLVVMKIPTSNTLSTSGFRLLVGCGSPGVGVSYIDEVRLYAVSAADYAAIGTTITGEAIDRLLPYVPPGINGVDGLWVRRYGKNLLPSVPDTLHANAKMNGPYEMALTATATLQSSNIYVDVLPNTTYTLRVNGTGGNIWERKVDASNNGGIPFGANTPKTITTKADTYSLRIELVTTPTSGTFTWKDWQLELGSTATPFQPREDSLIAFGGVELHANPNDGTEPDVLREVNGRYEVTRLWRKSNLVGDWSWIFDTNYTGYKRVRVTLLTPIGMNTSERVTKYNGSPLYPSAGIYSAADQSTLYNGVLYITIANTDSGWGDSYTPSQAEIQAYFNGWKMYEWTKSTSIPYNGTGTKAWARCTDGLSYGNTIPPVNNDDPNWKPYQLLYRLAVVTTETVQEDGSLSLIEGDNFIEVGSGYVSRDNMSPFIQSGVGYIVAGLGQDFKCSTVLQVYKNSLLDPRWTPKQRTSMDVNFGWGYAETAPDNIDFKSSYSVSYIKLDKSPVPGVTGFYATTEKAQLHDLTDGVTEALARVSVVEAKKAEKDAPAWIYPTLLNGWVPFDSTPENAVAYRRNGIVLELKGVIKSGVKGQAAFSLIKECIPKSTYHGTTVSNSDDSSTSLAASLAVERTGLVKPSAIFGGNGTVYINASVPLD